MMTSAPPFYYDDGFSGTERKEILASLGKTQTYETALSEYSCSHNPKELSGLLEKSEPLTA